MRWKPGALSKKQRRQTKESTRRNHAVVPGHGGSCGICRPKAFKPDIPLSVLIEESIAVREGEG